MGIFSGIAGAVGFDSPSDPNRTKSLLSEGQQQIQQQLTDFFQKFLFDNPTLAGFSNLAGRLFNETPIQRRLREDLSRNVRGSRNAFAGSDDALSRLLSGQTESLIGREELLSTIDQTVGAPLRLQQRRLLEEAIPAVNQAASAGGTRFSSRSGNVMGDLLQEAN